MSQVMFPFDLNGMFVEVLVSPGGDQLRALLAQGVPLPHPIWGRALIDTGTNVSAVSLAIIQQLGIPAGDPTSTQGISGPLPTFFYTVSLTITNKAASAALYSPPDVDVIGMPIPDIDVLIGLDILLACRLYIDGPAQRFTLDF